MALWTLKVRNYYTPFGVMDPKELKYTFVMQHGIWDSEMVHVYTFQASKIAFILK